MKGDPDEAGVDPNPLFENGDAAAGAAPPKVEPPEEPPNGLGAEPSVAVPKELVDAELNGEFAGTEVAGGAPNGD